MIDRERRIALAALSAAWLSACGGGRGKADGDPVELAEHAENEQPLRLRPVPRPARSRRPESEPAPAPSATPSPAPAPAFSPAPAPGVVSPEATGFIRLTDTPVDGATWLHANQVFAIKWNKPGGDWRDSSEAAQGNSAYATASVSGSSQSVVFDVTRLVAKWLADGNTGLHLRRVSGPTLDIASRAHSSEPTPTLSVVTSTGAFECRCLASVWIDPSSASVIQGSTTQAPTLMRFDLSSVTGTLTSAKLTIRVLTVFSGALPVVLAVNRLDAPRIVDNPSVQVGAPRQGIAAGVAGTDLDLARHASVLQYNDLSSDAAIRSSYVVVEEAMGLSAGPHSYVRWSEFGINAVRLFFAPINQGAIQWLKFLQPVDAPPAALATAAWRRPFKSGSELGYNELYARYMIECGADIKDGMNELGIKLSGLEGTYDFTSSGAVTTPVPSERTTWSYWTWHGRKSIEHPDLYRLATYSYDYDHSYYDNPSNGDARYCNLYNVCLRVGHKYCIEQRVKLNTITNSVPDANGIYELYVDGVLVHQATNLRIRGAPAVQIQSHRMLLYHGGMQKPVAPFHYDLAAAVIASEYIGPPKRLNGTTVAAAAPATTTNWAPAPGTIATVGLNTVADDPVVNPELDPAVNPKAFFASGTSPWHETSGIAPATVYSGAVFAPLLGEQGSMLMTMSGHSAYNDNGVYRYDCATRRFSRLADPYGSIPNPFQNGVTSFRDILSTAEGYPWYSSSATSEYFATKTKTETLPNQPAAFQSYDNNVYLPPGFAGAGAKGALLTTGRPARAPGGQLGGRQCHVMDLITRTWTRFGRPYAIGIGQGSACLAQGRRKVYVVSGASGSANHVKIIDLDTATITEAPFASSGFVGHQAGSNLRYSEARQCLFMFGWIVNNVYGLQVIDLDTLAVHAPKVNGTLPASNSLGGGEWVEEHQAYYYYDGGTTTPFALYRLTLPSGDPRTNAWTCTPITLSGTKPFVQEGGQSHNSRFKWCPAAQCFLWWPTNTNAVQAFRLPAA